MHKSEASHLAVHEHQRPHICAEEASGICKRVKRIHDPVKIVVPCAEVEFPIPPDISKRIQIRGRRVCTMIDDGCATSIEKASLASIDRHFTVSISRASRVLIAT
uniref:Uncharacterized protein n=1 Tax=Brassica oleracea var. oleracea TaxID=109376 RepID=A0A0D3BUY9_BRAOL